MDMAFVLTQAITQAIGVTAIIYLLATMGLNIQFGYTGLLNFGQIAFVAVGSYGIGVFVVFQGWNLWVSILAALLISVVLSLILGIPTLRLRADYLAIVTIATGEIMRLAAKSLDPLGGSERCARQLWRCADRAGQSRGTGLFRGGRTRRDRRH